MLYKSIIGYLTLLLSVVGSAKGETNATPTQTNTYIQPSFLSQLNNMFGSNPLEKSKQAKETGIKVVIVYECGASSDTSSDLSSGGSSDASFASFESPEVESITQTNTVVKTSDLTYKISTDVTQTDTTTVCENDNCVVTVNKNVTPSTVDSTTKVTYTTTETTTSASTKSKKTLTHLHTDYTTNTVNGTTTKLGTETVNFTTKALTISTAVTTTTTIFLATTQPSTYSMETTMETIATTQQNPVTTKAPVSSSQSVTISTASFTEDVTVASIVNKNSTFVVTTSNQTIVSTASNGTVDSLTTVAPSTYANSSAIEITTVIPHNVSTSTQFTTSQITSGYFANSSILSNSTISSSNSTVSLSNSTISLTLANVTVPVSTIVSSSIETVVTSSTAVGSAALAKLSASSTSTSSSAAITVSSNSNNYNGDAFNVIDTLAPPSVYSREALNFDMPDGVDNEGVPIETNKFYANLFLDSQTDMIWSYPYGLFWKTNDYYGFGVQHTNVSDRQFGSQTTNNEGVDSYYLNPTGNAEVIFSATSLTNSSNYMFLSDMESMSINVKLASTSTLGSDYIEIPVVQGMGFVTAIYHGDTVPLLNSLIGILTLTQETSSVLNETVLKYRATLFNGVEWIIYVTLPSSSNSFKLTASDPYNIKGSKTIDGLIIQVAVAPSTSSTNLKKRDESVFEGYYDSAAGMYVTDTEVEGTITAGTVAQYGFKYTTEGESSSGLPIVFALPHHVESLVSSVSQCATGISLSSTTKGEMYAYLTDELLMSETLQTDIQFLPWTESMTQSLSYTADQLNLLVETANEELQVDIAATVASMDSMYYSGKVLDKYAYILLVLHDIIQDEEVTNSTLAQMKEAFAPFIANEEYYPLIYDTMFGGVTSGSGQDGDTGLEFGATYYNDHHFHYGYFVHAAAIVGKVDKDLGGDWAETNKDWINSLVRDVANPSRDDPYFPVSRSFDWFAGHSWAAGLFASGDGKNQESSSEDYNFAYGMKLWGKVIGDESMESRGDLMLAVMTRSMNKYMYYKSDNTVEPEEILPNKVSGIFFENKVTYTTFFGSPDTNPEYVHGIHMVPITPASSLIRTSSYVEEEWKDQISTFIDNVDSGWTGILKLNQALYDPQTAYEFFSSSSWSDTYLDNGQSRTWSLAFSGGVANSC